MLSCVKKIGLIAVMGLAMASDAQEADTTKPKQGNLLWKAGYVMGLVGSAANAALSITAYKQFITLAGSSEGQLRDSYMQRALWYLGQSGLNMLLVELCRHGLYQS